MARPAPHWNYGKTYKDTKLYVFEPRRLTILSDWPNPNTWYKTPCKPWVSSRKRADQVLCDAGNTEEQIKRMFLYARMESENIDTHVSNGEQIEKYLSLYRPAITSPQTASDHKIANEYRAWKENILKDIASSRLEKFDKEAFYVHAYLNKVPEPARAVINKLQSRKWHMLCLLARVEGALELCDSNMALGYALASSWVFKNRPVKNHFRSIRALMGKKQTQILSWMDFPGSKLMRRTLAKIDSKDISIPCLLSIRNVMCAGKHNKIIAHLPRMDGYIAHMLLNPEIERKISVKFLEEFAFCERKIDEFMALRRSISLSSLLNQELPSIDSLNAVDEIYEELKLKIERPRPRPGYSPHNFLFPQKTKFPPPPFSGTPHVKPIYNIRLLRKEASRMNNCVASYADLIFERQVYIYRVIWPVRATISIFSKGRNLWLPDQAEYRHGEMVDLVTRDFIFSMLFNSQFNAEALAMELILTTVEQREGGA